MTFKEIPFMKGKYLPYKPPGSSASIFLPYRRLSLKEEPCINSGAASRKMLVLKLVCEGELPRIEPTPKFPPRLMELICGRMSPLKINRNRKIKIRPILPSAVGWSRNLVPGRGDDNPEDYIYENTWESSAEN